MLSNKTEQLNQLNLVHHFRPIYYFSRVFGFMSFSIVYDTKKKSLLPIVKIFDILWFMAFLCLYMALAFSTYRRILSSQISNGLYVLIIGGSMQILFSLILGAIITVMDMCNRRKLVNIVNKFYMFDKEVTLYFSCFNQTKYAHILY